MSLALSTPPLTSTDPMANAPQASIWRPVQYLGSKIRALEAITRTAADLTDGGTLWDAFSGSSVVSQSCAAAGFDVWATDTQYSAAVFASALLRVGATSESLSALVDVVWEIVQAPHPDAAEWAAWLEREDDALAADDYEALVTLHANLPQRWRSRGTWNDRTPMTTTFAGSYLSIRQAMALDAARHELDNRLRDGRVDEWTANATLTALCHAASEAVHSVGKHFAQPMQASTPEAPNYSFVRTRSLRDRAVSVPQKALAAAQTIASLDLNHSNRHRAARGDVLEVTSEQLRDGGVSIVYADPPYTAQQYSRYYHVLETLVLGLASPMQILRGSTPKGLYPADRYHSPFCSRRNAPAAFEHLIRTSRSANASLMLSYSTTGAKSGNQRTVSEADLLALVGEAYGPRNVSILDMQYGYRQLNQESRITETSGTGEVLILGVAQ